MTGTRRAIVTPVPGTTRDALTRTVLWRGRAFELVDTGGLYGASEDPLHELVARHGQRAVGGADLIVFLVDGREGLVPADESIAAELRRAGRHVILAINKIDDRRARDGSVEFYRLGFDPVLEVSAEHGQGVADLLDEILSALALGSHPSALSPQPSDLEEISVAVVGRPNVGKSSLVNRLLREERVLVSHEPGTTRDAVESTLTWHRRRFRIVDTAGMRRAGRAGRSGTIELVSVLAARRAIAAADVVALIVDACDGVADQDAAIGGEADRTGRGIVIVANKWDLVKARGPKFADVFDAETRRRMKFLDYAPILHISALTGERVAKVLETIDRIAASRQTRVPTPALNAFIETVTALHPPVAPRQKRVRILYGAQVAIRPPSFVLFTNVATRLHFSYQRYLVNQLRQRFGFFGTPIRLHVRRSRK
jgi:GTP-binding protein